MDTSTTPTSQDEARRAYQREYRLRNRERIYERQRAWRAARGDQQRKYARDYYARNRDRYRIYRLRTRYGAEAAEQILALEKEQEDKCALCRKQAKRLVVDHCHDSRRIRGLLCVRCNTALGALGDTEEAAQRLASYLRNS